MAETAIRNHPISRNQCLHRGIEAKPTTTSALWFAPCPQWTVGNWRACACTLETGDVSVIKRGGAGEGGVISYPQE